MKKLYAKDSGIAGTGCFAGQAFRKGAIVGEYRGDIIDEEEADERYADRDLIYLFELGDGKYIDGDAPDNLTKYINHSCEPNCTTEQRGDRVFIIALRSIKQDEELTYDYHLQVDPTDHDPYDCRCGSKGCRGTMRAAS